MKPRIKICERCNQEYLAPSGRRQYCDVCRLYLKRKHWHERNQRYADLKAGFDLGLAGVPRAKPSGFAITAPGPGWYR